MTIRAMKPCTTVTEVGREAKIYTQVKVQVNREIVIQINVKVNILKIP